MINDQEKPIAYASRSLTVAERNYSQLDREALAIVFGVNHFFNYLFGLRFTLVTDNEPLTRIFHHKKHLPSMTSSRLLRYSAFLSGFNYVIKFKRGETNENVDCLSRALITQTFTSTHILMGEEAHQVCTKLIDSITTETLTAEIVTTETEKDENLGVIKRDLLNESTDSSYTLNQGILFKNNRIVILKNLQDQILQELHKTHIGITKMKQLARRYVYWNRIDKDIENLVKSCRSCALLRSSPQKAPLHPWDEPTSNWERIHIMPHITIIIF